MGSIVPPYYWLQLMPLAPLCAHACWRARMPHSRKALNSSLMKRGSSDPMLASVCAMKLAACCWTRRNSVVCLGWRRS